MALKLYITQAQYEGGHTLSLSFNDGTKHTIDFTPFFLAHPHTVLYYIAGRSCQALAAGSGAEQLLAGADGAGAAVGAKARQGQITPPHLVDNQLVINTPRLDANSIQPSLLCTLT